MLRRLLAAVAIQGPGWPVRLATSGLVLFLGILSPVEGTGQTGFAPGEVFVNSEAERYLRLVQGRGLSREHPWSVRSFSPAEAAELLPRDPIHPWAGRFQRTDSGEVSFAWLRPEMRLIYNSRFPYGSNDGAIWAGRGLTTAIQAGFSTSWGPVSLVVAPVMFRSENQALPPAPDARSEDAAFAARRFPRNIDLPQRFGDEPYTRLDPGQSTLRVDALGMAVGASTANQHWGPARDQPLLLGNSAPGFPHLFAGSSRPIGIGIGKVHGRIVWGRLHQTPYFSASPDSTLRFMSGLAGVFMPRGAEGLEIGVARFIHSPWPADGLGTAELLQPFSGVLSVSTENSVENQLATLFARWVLSGSGLELYGEYVRDDFAHDLRDFALNADVNSGYMLGFQKSWSRAAGEWVVARGEVVNTRSMRGAPLGFGTPLYVHSRMRQGHTERGQLLASSAGYGGAGSVLGVDYYHRQGRWSLDWSRLLNEIATPREREAEGLEDDVVHAVGLQGLFFRGRFDLEGTLTGVYNLNRHLDSDAFNLHGQLLVRVGL